MKYSNGRTAREGDPVVTPHGRGYLHSIVRQHDVCNGRLAKATATDPWVTVSECLHADDAARAEQDKQTKKDNQS